MQPDPRLARDAPDGILAGRAAGGDVAAFEALVRRYGGLVRAYTITVVGAADGADDVVQDTFIRAWERLEELKDPAAFRPWLMRIASRRAIEILRRRKPEVELVEEYAPPSRQAGPAESAEVRMQLNDLSQTLARMPRLQRECWLLKQLGGLSYAEIGDQFGIPSSTVRGQLARARATLIREMEAWR